MREQAVEKNLNDCFYPALQVFQHLVIALQQMSTPLPFCLSPFDCMSLCCRWSGRNHREKIGVHVLFDQVLNMEPYCCRDPLSSLDKETFVYDLSAVVMHHGKGFGSGHYTAYCYNTEGGACALLQGKNILHLVNLPLLFKDLNLLPAIL